MVLTEVRPVRSGTDLNWLLFKRLKKKNKKNKNKNKQTNNVSKPSNLCECHFPIKGRCKI